MGIHIEVARLIGEGKQPLEIKRILANAPSTHKSACPRVKVASLPRGLIPGHYIEALEQNQLIAHCCRHPENHEVEALYSSEAEKAPDIYIFHCTCGRQHRRFCVGGGDVRPFWDVH